MARRIQVLFNDRCGNCTKELKLMDYAFLVEKGDLIEIDANTYKDMTLLCVECWDKKDSK